MGNGKTTLTDLFPRRIGGGFDEKKKKKKKHLEKRSWGKGKFSEFGMNAIQEHTALENCGR